MTKARRAKAKAAHVEANFELTDDEYWAIYEAQGGCCYGCQRARGQDRQGRGGRKRLSVDHDHSCDAGHPPEKGCRRCVRGLLCSTCNKTLGHFRDDPDPLTRLAEYLRNPPARRVLRLLGKLT